jgi:transposase
MYIYGHMKNQDARFLHPVTQRDLRQKAVDLFLSGISKIEISKQLCVSRQSVYKWLKAYEKDGENGISIDRRGRPKGTQIKPWQCAQIVYFIKNHNPDELSLPFFLWTRDVVSLLILQKFGIKLSKWTVGRYLANWGFSSQKPARKAIEQNPVAIKKWFEVEYPLLQKLAKNEMATIHWGDEMGLRSDHNAGRSYGLIGKTPVVKRSGNRFLCNMISTITNLGKLSFMIFHENFTSKVFLRFLKRLIQQTSRKVFLIVDRHRAHRSKQVQQWLTKNEKTIRVFYLPSYCPELNPDEFLNQDVKTHLGKKRVKNKAEMIKNLNSHLRMRQKQPDVIQNFIRGCHSEYAA